MNGEPVDVGPVDAAICMRLLVLLMPGWTFVERHGDNGYGIFLVPASVGGAAAGRFIDEVHDQVLDQARARREEFVAQLARAAAARNN